MATALAAAILALLLVPSPAHAVTADAAVCGGSYTDWTGTFRGYTGTNTGAFGGEYVVSMHNNDNSAHQTYRNLVDGSISARPPRLAMYDARTPAGVRIYYYSSGSTTSVERVLTDPVCEPGTTRVLSAGVRTYSSYPPVFTVSRQMGVCGSHVTDYAGQNFVGFLHTAGGETKLLNALFTTGGDVVVTLDGDEVTVPVTFGTQRVASGRPLPEDPYREVARLDWTAWAGRFLTVTVLCPTGTTKPTRLDGAVYANGDTFELVAGSPPSRP